MVNVRFRDAVFGKLVTEREYLKICESQPENLEVYIREFTHPLCSPDLQKYEFSLREIDWHRRDRKRCAKLFLVVFGVWEAWILLMILQP